MSVCSDESSDFAYDASVISSDHGLHDDDGVHLDLVDRTEDGVIVEQDDMGHHHTFNALWDMPVGTRGDDDLSSCTAEARYVFEHDEIDSGAWDPLEYDDVAAADVLSWADSDESTDVAKAVAYSKRKKTPAKYKDAETTQDPVVIDGIVAAIEAQGGLPEAEFAFIDFEAACVHSANVCAPCEVGLAAATLSLNDVPTAASHSGTYHRMMHPGIISAKMQQTAHNNQTQLHGIPYGEEGIAVSGSAYTAAEVHEVLEDVQELLCRTAGKHWQGTDGRPGRGFRKSQAEHPGVRMPPPAQATCKALLFGYGVAVERAALNSLAHVARCPAGDRPFRWELPVYDVQHLVQALHVMTMRKNGTAPANGAADADAADAPAGKKKKSKAAEAGRAAGLLSAYALEGICLWGNGRAALPGGAAQTAAPCKYHRFFHRRAIKYGVLSEDPDIDEPYHCALNDAMSVAEKARFIACRYFPTLALTSGGAPLRHPLDPTGGRCEWPPLPQSLRPTPEIEVARSLGDLRAHAGFPPPAEEGAPPPTWARAEWFGPIKTRVFEAVAAAARGGDAETAGLLTRAWYKLSQSACIS
eukprot:TRINITY_DN1307_c0_g1_i1.p1 TRINITY_DN1307_c0_g1~~TRINITY_DN1307_c0_g1_i1.p1  ORF type:complete len:584 (+),score=185.88 TRINITY_DN1307_c0_g1_i1:61-1812(+)